MPSFRLNRFGGGLTDDYLDAQNPEGFEVLENVYIDQNSKIVQREGFDFVGGQVDGGNTPVTQITAFRADESGGDPNTHDYYVSYTFQKKMYYTRFRSYTSLAIDYEGYSSKQFDLVEYYPNILGVRSAREPDNLKTNTNTRLQKSYSAKTHLGIVTTFDTYSRPLLWNEDSSIATTTEFTTLGLRDVQDSVNVDVNALVTANSYSYIWYYHYFYTYSIGGKDFVVNGPVESVQDVLGHGVGISGEFFRLAIPGYTPTLGEETPTVSMALYRTTANSTESFFVAFATEPFAAAWDITDNYTDTEIINGTGAGPSSRPTGLPASVYISGGVLDDEEAPSAKYCTWANDVLWLGNIQFEPNRMRYSKPKQPHSFPGSFFHDFPDTITGMSFIDIYPIVFTSGAVYRMENITTATGSGELSRRLITDRMGTLTPHGIVKAEDKVYWLGEDGVYVTNGYTHAKVTTRYDNSLLRLLQPGYLREENSLSSIVGTYNSTQKRIYWAIKQEPDGNIELNGPTNDIVIALDLKSDGPKIYTYYAFPEQDPSLVGGYADRDAGYYPVSVCAVEEVLLAGDSRGLIVAHEKRHLVDQVVNLNTPASRRIGTVFHFITSAFSFGTEHSRKWVPSIIVSCKNFFNASRNLTLQLFSINDDDKTNVKFLQGIAEERTDNKVHNVRRKFVRGGLRSQYKQVGFRKGLKTILSYDDLGEYIDVTGTTVQLQNGANWGQYILEAFLYTSADNFSTGTAILTASPGSDTATLYLAAPVDGTDLTWYIRAYTQDEKFRLEAIEIPYTNLGESVREYDGA